MQLDDNLIKNRRLLVLLLLLISNIVLLSVLHMFGYYFVPYLKSPGFYIILVNEILIVRIFINLKKTHAYIINPFIHRDSCCLCLMERYKVFLK